MQSLDIGKILREQRTRKNISIETIAHETHIHLHFLEALEQEKWDTFPARVYLYGFLEQYAKHLGLVEADELVKRLKQAFGEQEKPFVQDTVPEEAEPEVSPEFPARIRSLLYMCVLLIVAGLYFYNVEIKSKENDKSLLTSVETADAVKQSDQAILGNHEFMVNIKKEDWLRVWVDQRVRFEGRMVPGKTRFWVGQTFRLQAKDMSKLEVIVDGKPLSIGGDDSPFEIIWPNDPTT